MSQEQPHEKQQRIKNASAIFRRPHVANSERRSQHEPHDQSGLRSASDQSPAFLSVRTRRRTRRAPSPAASTTRAQETAPDRRSPARRSPASARSDCGNFQRRPAAEKGTLVIEPYRRYTADEKAAILATIAQVQEWCPEKNLDAILNDLGLPPATYRRWCERAEYKQLADHIVVPHHDAVPPTPAEVACVRAFAERHFGMGYKRLAYGLMLENQAFCIPGWCTRFCPQ